MTPATLGLAAYHNADFIREIVFTAPVAGVAAPLDLTGHVAQMQIRLYGAQPGSALVSLASVTADVQGVWIAEPTQGRLRIRIDRSALAVHYATLSAGRAPGATVNLEYDLAITAPDGLTEIFARGPFALQPGVTI